MELVLKVACRMLVNRSSSGMWIRRTARRKIFYFAQCKNGWSADLLSVSPVGVRANTAPSDAETGTIATGGAVPGSPALPSHAQHIKQAIEISRNHSAIRQYPAMHGRQQA